MKRFLLAFGMVCAATISRASTADVLTSRYKQTGARIDTLFSHRTPEAGKTPIKENPFRVGSDTAAGSATTSTPAGEPAPAIVTGDAELLSAGVEAIKLRIHGIPVLTNQTGTNRGSSQNYVLIDTQNYQEGERVRTSLPGGQIVYLRIVKIVPKSVGQSPSVTFGYNDLQIDVQL